MIRYLILGGMLILLWVVLGGFAPLLAEAEAEPESCLLKCVRSHAQWGYPRCRQIDLYLKGPECYAIYNECFSQRCGSALHGLGQKAFMVPPDQLQDRWRQGSVCHPDVEKFPLELLPGDQVIDPQWSGQCECRNGHWIKAACGHKERTCQQVCNTKITF